MTYTQGAGWHVHMLYMHRNVFLCLDRMDRWFVYMEVGVTYRRCVYVGPLSMDMPLSNPLRLSRPWTVFSVRYTLDMVSLGVSGTA